MGKGEGRRAVRVGDQILKIMALLLVEKVRDPRVSEVTLTGIKLSNDLKLARVYFSIRGGEERVVAAVDGLESAKGFIRREVGRRAGLRYVPEIRFIHDRSLQEASQLEDLFKRIRSEEDQ